MAEELEIYDDGSEGADEFLAISLVSNPKLWVKGPGMAAWGWGMRRQVDERNTRGTYNSLLEAVAKVWLMSERTTWNLFCKDPKTGSVVEMPRTEEVLDGMVRPRLKAEDFAHISLKLGTTFYPEHFPAGLFDVSAEGESVPPSLAEESND